MKIFVKALCTPHWSDDLHDWCKTVTEIQTHLSATAATIAAITTQLETTYASLKTNPKWEHSVEIVQITDITVLEA